MSDLIETPVAGLPMCGADIAAERLPRLIRMTAKELAEAHYEEDRSPQFRLAYPNCKGYVRLCWPYFVKPAKEVLTSMLGMPGVHENLKRPIYEALIAPGDHHAQLDHYEAAVR